MARHDEAVHLPLARREEGFQGGRDQFEQRGDEKVLEAGGPGARQHAAYDRGGGLETDADEDDLAGAFRAGDIQGVEGRVHHAHVGAFLAGGLQVQPLAALDLQHVAESGRRDAGQQGQFYEPVDIALRSDADGAAGAREHLDRGREQAAQAGRGDGHGMRAADLHEVCAAAAGRGQARGLFADGRDHAVGQFPVAEKRRRVGGQFRA